MGEQHRTGRDPAHAADMRASRRFPISPVGWIGIAAAALGIAYFLLPLETAQERSERKPPADSREAGPATAKRYDDVAPSPRATTADQRRGK